SHHLRGAEADDALHRLQRLDCGRWHLAYRQRGHRNHLRCEHYSYNSRGYEPRFDQDGFSREPGNRPGGAICCPPSREGRGVSFEKFKSTTAELIEEAKQGRMFVLVDDEDRENEGDLVIPAQMATPETINFMAKHARGLICLALTREREIG